MENQKFVAIDELAFNPLPIRDSVKNKLFQTPEDQRRWSVQQIQSSEGTMSWQIQVDVQDGSKKLYPLADGTILNSGGLPAQRSLAVRGIGAMIGQTRCLINHQENVAAPHRF